MAWMALAWFVVGLLLGQRVKSAVRGKSRRARNRQAPARSRGSGGGGPRSSVELYVGNLPYSTDETELTNSFARHGKVVEVRIIRSGSNGRSKGYGFVTMGSESDSKAAIKNMHALVMDDREIVVNAAKARTHRD
jgi:RNA recognition motif-containing protein